MKLASALGVCLVVASCADKPAPTAPAPIIVAQAASPSACPAAARVGIKVELPAPGFVPAPPRGASQLLPQRLRPDIAQYPSASLPCREQGKVGVTFCVNAQGRVDNAQIVSSSGYARLDNAVLVWLQGDRYTPGAIDGAAHRYCGLHLEREFEVVREQPEHAAVLPREG